MSKAKIPSVRKKREPLTRPNIVETAAQLIEHDGLEDFSMRKLALSLKCEPMSLYHHFPSKAYLMDALLDNVLAELEYPSTSLAPVERLRQVAIAYRAMALRHPKFFSFMALHRMNTVRGIHVLNAVLEIFFSAGLDAATAARLFRSFGYYLTGAALDETNGYAQGPSAVEPVADEVIVRDFPHLAATAPYFKSDHFSATFNSGLELLLDGFQHAVDAARAR